MKRTHLIAVLVGIIAVSVFATNASAYYHPGMGVFMSRDPGVSGAMRVGTAGTAPVGQFIPRDQYRDGMNLYQYVRSVPTKYVDPDGKRPALPGGTIVNHDGTLDYSSDRDTMRTSSEVARYRTAVDLYNTNVKQGSRCWPTQQEVDKEMSKPARLLTDTSPPDLNLPPGGSALGDPKYVQWVCDKWITEEFSGQGWLKTLPSCPCTLSGVRSNSGSWTSPQKADQTYHRGACECTRSKNNDGGPGQQCCYDSKEKLITKGAGAGTPDKVAPEGAINIVGHYFADVKMFSYCRLKLGDEWVISQYNKVRPPNNGNNCQENWGDSR